MEEFLEKEIVVSEGQRPLWQRVIAALLYTVMFFTLLFYFYLLHNSGLEDLKKVRNITGLLQISFYCFIGGLNFSIVKTLFINLEKEKLKTEYRVGIFSIKYFSEFPKLEYVSVFKHYYEKNDNTIFEINLWYKGNKHFNVSNFEEFQPAMDFGLMFSNKLNLDLLDATEKGNSKWI